MPPIAGDDLRGDVLGVRGERGRQRLSRRAVRAAVVLLPGDDEPGPLEVDADLKILTTKDPEALQVYRHSTAHLLAEAVRQPPEHDGPGR